MPYLGNNLGVAFSSYKLIDSLTASFNGTTTSFALTVNGVTPVPFPLNEQNILISVGGVPQKPDSTGTEGFRFSGSNIVFSSAPKTGEAFWGVVLAGADRVNAGVQYPDGTASVPSITFASQTTTGFYRSGSGQIGVGINGSTPVVFSTSGVQINGSTSGSVIIASPAVAGNNTLTLPTSNGSANQFLKNGATAGSLGYSSLVEDSSGNVGIGTASPGVKVDIVSDNNTSLASVLRVNSNNFAVNTAIAYDGITGSSQFQIRTSSANPLLFGVNNTECARIDSSGRLLVGTSSARTTFYNGGTPTELQVEGDGEISVTRNVNDNFGCSIILGKSRSTANTILSSGDIVGNLSWQGSDGTDFVEAANIKTEIDGTPGANDMPGRLVFSTTADGASSTTERMRIDSFGRLLVGTSTNVYGARLTCQSVTGTTASVFSTDTASEYGTILRNTATSGNNGFALFETEPTPVTRGSITYNRAGGVVAYNTTSDYRAKTLLGALENPGETIDALKVYRGVMNGATIERPMLIAHEAQEVAPYCVTGEKDAVDDDGKPIYQQMDHQVLLPLLIAEIQQLRARVAALEAA